MLIQIKDTGKELEAALKVMVFDSRIRTFLKKNDPMALKQALKALKNRRDQNG